MVSFPFADFECLCTSKRFLPLNQQDFMSFDLQTCLLRGGLNPIFFGYATFFSKEILVLVGARATVLYLPWRGAPPI
jgi:hypothetical protein